MCQCNPECKTPFCGKPGCTPPVVRAVIAPKDPIDTALDEMADLCVHWKRNRAKGYTPQATRQALLMISQECAAMAMEAARIEAGQKVVGSHMTNEAERGE